VLDTYVNALGGKAAIQAPTSRVMKGTISMPAIGAKGTIAIYAKAPNKELTEMSTSVTGSWRGAFNTPPSHRSQKCSGQSAEA
jgi:hypothetical protein